MKAFLQIYVSSILCRLPSIQGIRAQVSQQPVSKSAKSSRRSKGASRRSAGGPGSSAPSQAKARPSDANLNSAASGGPSATYQMPQQEQKQGRQHGSQQQQQQGGRKVDFKNSALQRLAQAGFQPALPQPAPSHQQGSGTGRQQDNSPPVRPPACRPPAVSRSRHMPGKL